MKKSEKVIAVIGVIVITILVLTWIDGIVTFMNTDYTNVNDSTEAFIESMDDLTDDLLEDIDELEKIQDEYGLTDDELVDVVDYAFVTTLY